MRKCTGSAVKQITPKHTDISLTSVSQACSYDGENQTR